ncbi:uncharacterized protein LOC118436008 isoform X2 [Folsomia candida]|uniref:uncharacterized protein LOC118436008 isoform X2 n=1 Tax=Folsomia candida TaxID=158441 RepID=UPI0016054122|nr:uncharacterized protein LOC118436008 isoform X2 [Folsomia candida]
MALVQIPRYRPDPSWPQPEWPYHVYPWKLPTFLPNGDRVPDYMPLIDPPPPKGRFKWLPTYNGLPTYESLLQNPYRHWTWLMSGDLKKLKTSGYKKIPKYFKDKLMYFQRFDQEYIFHSRGKFYGTAWTIPNYARYSYSFYRKENKGLRKWGPKSLDHLAKPYHLIYDSRFQHPTSHLLYSVVRINPKATTESRRKFYCSNWAKNVTNMARMVESSAADQHQIIIIEQTPLADLLMKRIMYGSNLSDMCIWMCLATIISCHYRIRWPSMYLFPCLVGVYCWHVYKWEYRHDPSWRYGFWTTWVNDPTEHEHFEEHLDVHSELLLHERMTFMQLENMSYRRPVNSIFTKISVLWALRTMMKRIRYRGVAEDMAWDALQYKF